MVGHKNRCGWAWTGRVWHPTGLPQGLPHDSPGAEPHDARTGSVEGCPRPLRGRARQADGMPHEPTCKISADPAVPLRSLTENQVLGERIPADQSPRPEPLDYIS
jgi:hypothetical protein